MNSTPKTPKMSSKDEARAAYDRNMKEAEEQIAKLQKILAAHKAEADQRLWRREGGHGPHWGHVGDIANVAERLKDITSSFAEVA